MSGIAPHFRLRARKVRRRRRRTARDLRAPGALRAALRATRAVELFIFQRLVLPGDVLGAFTELAVLPTHIDDIAFAVEARPSAVLLALGPLARIARAVGPRERSLALLHVHLVLTFVNGTSGELHPSLPTHMAVGPISIVVAPVRERVCSLPVHHVVHEVADVLNGVVLEHTLAVLEAVHVLTLVPGAIGPPLHADAGLHVVPPLPLVHRAVEVRVDAETVFLAALPRAVVPVAVHLCEDALAVRQAVSEAALVLLTRLPSGGASAVHLVAQPLPRVEDVAVLHFPLGTLHQAIPIIHRHIEVDDISKTDGGGTKRTTSADVARRAGAGADAARGAGVAVGVRGRGTFFAVLAGASAAARRRAHRDKGRGKLASCARRSSG
mmetsp:Transcript_18430/g.51237  ORF Transcript_18430/g.51237 Transcript_18430/m.51237 type:complete len:382 (-) Transcript_18430:312-1457(-)